MRAEVAAAQRRAERAEAEAALARQLLAELRVAPRERDDGGGRRRKARPAPTEKEAQSEKQGEEEAEEQSAPTASLNPDDDSDGITTAMTGNNGRADAIRWIQDQMAEYGLTMAGLEAGGASIRRHHRHRRSTTATPRE